LIPLASEIGLHARQQLVGRLDTYQLMQKSLFQEAIDFINSDIIPVVKRHAIAGRATLRTENMKCTNPLFIDIVLDTLSERGYHVIFDSKETDTPDSINPKTWKISFLRKRVFFFHLQFPRHQLRH
jgi:adenylate kinase